MGKRLSSVKGQECLKYERSFSSWKALLVGKGLLPFSLELALVLVLTHHKVRLSCLRIALSESFQQCDL